MSFAGAVEDSFSLLNVGQDTLRYRIDNRQALDTGYTNSSWYTNPVWRQGDSLLLAMTFHARADFVLLGFGFFLSSSRPTIVEFSVYQGPARYGDYTRIFTRAKSFDSLAHAEPAWSGPIDKYLTEMHYYIFTVAWNDTVRYATTGTGGTGGSDGLGLFGQGSFARSSSFPSDSVITLSAVDSFSYYEFLILGGFSLWIDLLSDSSGALAPGESSQVAFRVRDPSYLGASPCSTAQIKVYSNDPVDSVVSVDIKRWLVTAVDHSFREGLPQRTSLMQNYPNPFNPSTTIRYGLPSRSHVTLTVFNTLGQQVATLVEGEKEAGFHEAVFDASGLASGVYLYRLQAGSVMRARTLMLLR